MKKAQSHRIHPTWKPLPNSDAATSSMSNDPPRCMAPLIMTDMSSDRALPEGRGIIKCEDEEGAAPIRTRGRGEQDQNQAETVVTEKTHSILSF